MVYQEDRVCSRKRNPCFVGGQLCPGVATRACLRPFRRSSVRGDPLGDRAECDDPPFTADVVDRFVHRERMQAAGAGVLALAWEHRAQLLS